MGRVLVACEFSGVVRDAFTDAGHYAMSCDLLESESPGNHYRGDVRDIIGAGWDLMVAHPTCTRMANSGVRWLWEPPAGRKQADMWLELYEGIDFYRTLRDAPIRLKAVENPVMHKYARWMTGAGARHIVQPWWFGDPVFKATGFELIGLPELVPTNKLTPPQPGTEEHKAWSVIHRASPGPDRAAFRSRFFPRMAAAMAQQWGALLD